MTTHAHRAHDRHEPEGGIAVAHHRHVEYGVIVDRTERGLGHSLNSTWGTRARAEEQAEKQRAETGLPVAIKVREVLTSEWADSLTRPQQEKTTCLVPVWDDGIYRVRCGMGTSGVCAKHGPHQPHPNDGRACDAMDDGYCRTHGVYVDPSTTDPRATAREDGGES